MVIKIFLFVLFFGLFLITNLYENYCREKESESRVNKSNHLANVYGKFWHWYQFGNWFIVFTYAVYLLFGLSWIAASIVLLIGASWWILFDGFLNRLRGKKFFYRSEFSTSEFEQYAYPKTKIGILILSIILLVIAL